MRKALSGVLVAALTLSAAVVGATAATADETPPSAPSTTKLERVSAYTQPSVVYLGISWQGRVYDKFNKQFLNDGNPFFFDWGCTGFVVNPDGWIATAGHCVDPDEVRPVFYEEAARWALDNGYYVSTTLTLDDVLGFNDYVVKNDAGKNQPTRDVVAAWSVSAGGVETGKALPARVVKFQSFDNGDGAMLKVEATDLNALPLSDAELEIGTEIVAIGYPATVDLVTDATFTPSFKDGSVSSRKTVSGGLLTVYEISAAVSGGMSGGPTVNLDGEVVGFNSFGINSQIETQAFNFVRPVTTVRELLGDAGTVGELSEDAQDYRAGLDAYFAGDKVTAVEKLESVVDNQPTHEMAKTYLDRAQELPDPPEPASTDEGGSGLLIGLGIGAGVLVLLAGVVLLWLLRRGKRGASPASPTTALPYGAPPAGGPAYQMPPAPTGPQPVMGRVVPPLPGPTEPPPPSTPPPPAPTTTVTAVPVDQAEPAAEEEDDDLFCPECGTRGEPHQKFCKHCGAHL